MIIKIKQFVSYATHTVTANGTVNLTLKSKYGELVNSIQHLQLLNNDIAVKVRLPEEKPFKLGIFRIKDIRVDGDGESVIKLTGLNDYIEMNNLNNIVMKDEFEILSESDVEEEQE